MKLAVIFFSTLFAVLPAALSDESKPSPEIVVHLLDYLAKDYGGAVQNGKVVSQSEYSEQVEFADIVKKNAEGVEKLKSNRTFASEVNALKEMISSKSSADAVAKLARKLQQDAIKLSGIDVAPRSAPDLSSGGKLYQTNCIACHGESGHGDGTAGAGLDPKPANFHDPDLVWNSAPYKFYNTIRLGVPGTGMAAFQQLSDKEVWDLSFYLKSLPFENQPNPSSPAKITLTDAATMTDQEIALKLGGDSQQVRAAIGSLRAVGSVSNNNNPLETARRLLSTSIEAAKIGDFTRAKDLALAAYLEGIEPLEPKMRANLPGSVEEIEAMMGAFRGSLGNQDAGSKLDAQGKEIFGKLDEVERLFDAKMSPSVAFGAAFSIFLREGFEAVLIIVILISILKAMNQPKAIRWVHIGWTAAVVTGIASWFASGMLLSMSGLGRELLEGVISLFAVVVLIYVGFWLHRYTEMKKWRTFLEIKLKAGLTQGSYFALAVVAFMAVFREAFEVVLFLRAIWIDLDQSGQSIAGLGVFSSVGILILISYFAVKESKKLPIGVLFQVCSWTMMVLAIILMGKGIHSLQEAGMVGMSPSLLSMRVELFGIYPSYQTLIAQFMVVVLFAAILLKDKKPAVQAN